MKKHLHTVLAALLCAGLLAIPAKAGEAPLSIITTIFPEYDWVQNILGDNPAGIEVTMLLDSGVDLHSYQPTIPDLMRIIDTDMFVYVGGESDGWVDDALAQSEKDGMIVLNLIECLGEDAKVEETVEGMEPEEEEEEEENGEEEEEEIDEHIWLSLKNAQKLVVNLTDAIKELDPDHADVYEANAAAYLASLADLDAKYQEAADNAKTKTVLFGDRFPFRYLMDDYGLSYYAAFSGCSAESEASFETIIFLAGKVDELALPAVLTLEHPQTHIAETIVENTREKNQAILSMDSLQSTTSGDLKDGRTYLAAMEENLAVLTQALQ